MKGLPQDSHLNAWPASADARSVMASFCFIKVFANSPVLLQCAGRPRGYFAAPGSCTEVAYW